MSKTLRSVAGVFLVVGPILLAFVGTKSVIDRYVTIPEWIYGVVLFFSVLLLLAAPLAWFGSFVRWNRKMDAIYKAELLTENELGQLHEFCSELLPGALAPLSLWKERYRKNPSIFYVVRKSLPDFRRPVETVVGSFSLIPISKAAKAALDQEAITGLDLHSKEIIARRGKPAAVYLSWVLARGYLSKSHTLSLMNEKLKEISKAQSIMLYAKPSTMDGLRLMQQYGFVPVNPSVSIAKDVVCKRQLQLGSLVRKKRNCTTAKPPRISKEPPLTAGLSDR